MRLRLTNPQAESSKFVATLDEPEYIDCFFSEEPFEQLSAEGESSWFTKFLLPEGAMYHPRTKKVQVHPKEELEAFAAGTNQFFKDTGLRPAFPDGHTESARTNMGYWENFRVQKREDGKHWLAADVEVPDEGIAKKIGKTIKNVSIWFKRNVIAQGGKAYKALILHAGATDYPVVQ